ncbi:MAG: hypothetical protein IJT88_10745 [Kiritimatiellae bacterium]|nr:hypothetical protein [Kiritimatiellia bacterium]
MCLLLRLLAALEKDARLECGWKPHLPERAARRWPSLSGVLPLPPSIAATARRRCPAPPFALLPGTPNHV